jgi:predicted dehydrogenase/threonine dehydrogenase-like Zn-dependent dehydrogenase
LKDGHLELKDVPLPLCKSKGVLVRTRNSLISIGTEKSLIDLARKGLVGKARARPDLLKRLIEKGRKEGFFKVYKEALNRLDEPFPLGYSASGIVVEVGKGADEFAVGDHVAVSGSGFANHAEYNFVPENLCVRLPDRRVNGEEGQITNNESANNYISFEEAAFGMVGAIALNGVRDAGITFGENAVVIGLGLIGLITVQILRSVGCHAIGLDIDDNKISLARELGCEDIININKDNPVNFVMDVTGGIGTDAVIITASAKDNEPIEIAEKIARHRGRIVLVGVSAINLDRKYFWDKELSFKVSRAAGPGIFDENYELKGVDYPIGYIRWTEKRNIEYFLQLVAEGKVDVKKLITHRFPFDDAISVYERLLGGRERYVGVLFAYPETDSRYDLKKLSLVEKRAINYKSDRTFNIGFIGGGMFSKNTLLPALKQMKDVQLVGVATTRGMTSNHIGEKFGFSYSTTDYNKILEDENIGTVFITTRHDLHAQLVMEAVKAGKNVFVEKPLCLNKKELNEIIKTYNESPVTNNLKMLVGFNRRYSPHAADIRDFFAGSEEPFVINWRINAGFIESEHWSKDMEIGGGRIIGEVCHFIDFLQFVTKSDPVKVYTGSIKGSKRFGTDDNIVSVIHFKDGSISTITYTAKGSKSYPREIIEIFQDESIYYLEDFRVATKVKGGKKETKKLFSQDMGYKGELEYFFSGKYSNKDVEGFFMNSLTAFAMVESLKKAEVIEVSSII